MFKRVQLPYDKTFLFESVKINYYIFGKGKKVVFLHGSLTNSSGYQPFIHQLARHYQLYILDLPGFGASDTVPNRMHNGELFFHVFSAFIKKFKLENVPYIGLSYGATVVAASVVKNNLQNRLVLIAPPGKTSEDILGKVSMNLPLFIKRFLTSTHWGRKNLVLPIIRANTESKTKNNNQKFLQDLSHTDSKAIADPNYKHEIQVVFETNLCKMKNRMLVLYGEYDRFKTHQPEGIKSFTVVKNSGHNICEEAPEETVKLLRSFL